jgi:hypothetical protein
MSDLCGEYYIVHYFWRLFLFAAVLEALAAGTPGPVRSTSSATRLTPTQAREVIATEARHVISAIRLKNFDQLARYVNPARGVRFSPNATIDTQQNTILSVRELRSGFRDASVRTWGYSDASGDPIRLTFSKYYRHFIYDRDFAQAPVVRFNEFAAKSTDRNNFWEIYPNAISVEYYFPPSTPKSNDWAALRLAFERQAGKWFLVGVVHDAWTM